MALNFDKLTLHSYLNTEYLLTVEGQKIIFQIGNLHSKSEHLFRSRGVRTYAWMTACNPRSVKKSGSENIELMRKLHRDLKNVLVFEGLSRSQDGSWAEDGIWVCNCDLDGIRKLATKYGQNAFTFAIMGHSMKLILV